MGWRPKNLNDSLFPLHTILAIVGLNAFQYPLGQPRIFFSVIYTIIVTSLYCVAIICTVKHSSVSSWVALEEHTYLSTIFINNVIAGLALILSWYHMKRKSRAMNKLMKVDETLKDLDVSLDHMKFMYDGIAIIACWLLIIITTNTLGLFWYTNDVPVSEATIVSIMLHHAVHMNAIVAINFVVELRLLDVRFCKVNELLEEASKHSHRRPLKVYPWFLRNNVIETNSFILLKRRKNLVQVMKHVHLELVNIAHDIEHTNGVQILLVMTAYFVMYTGLLYDLYTTIVNSSPDSVHMRLIILITWLMVDSVKLITINYLCERVSAEAKKTGDLIHCIDSSEDSEFPDEIRQFSLQLMHNPLCFSPAGFFTLGFQFVQGFFSSAVTYLMILIQIGSVTTELQ